MEPVPAKTNIWPIIIALALPNVGGWVGAYAVAENIDDWYKTLNKPTWTPPSYAFGPIWTVLYTCIGYASYLVWKDGGGFQGASLALFLYAVQLVLNWAWSPIFFIVHTLKWSLVEIGILDVCALCCAVAFTQIRKTSGVLFIPYLAWLGTATALNYYIFANNDLDNMKINTTTFQDKI